MSPRQSFDQIRRPNAHALQCARSRFRNKKSLLSQSWTVCGVHHKGSKNAKAGFVALAVIFYAPCKLTNKSAQVDYVNYRRPAQVRAGVLLRLIYKQHQTHRPTAPRCRLSQCVALPVDGWILFCRRIPPRINIREDQLATHALVLARGLHGAAVIALNHWLVTGCATSVAFVDCCHRPEICFR